MIVADASVITNMLLYTDDRGRKARAALGRDPAWMAPEHWKAEVFSAVRGLAIGRKIGERDALHAVARIPRLGVVSVATDLLLPRMWELRHAISAYDAAYTTLAERDGLELVTADSRLARAAIRYCRVDLAH